MSKGMNDKTELKTIKMIQQIGSDIDWNTKVNQQLVAGILEIKNADEANKFFRDLMTPAEIKEFAYRLEAAKLLSQDVQYNYITETTGLSSATIARIKKWLEGSLGGYRLILSRLANTSTKLSASHHPFSKLRKGLSLT
jgi:TrpR-related protein YerC/YecD